MKKKMLVSGGAGFIGSHLCDFLYEQGHEIIAVDNLSLGCKENISSLIDKEGFTFIEDDITNIETMSQLFEIEKFDMVYHLAANSDIAKSFEYPQNDLNNTFLTTSCILQLMKKYNVRKFFFASTSAIYGDTDKLLHEDFGPLMPISHYGAAKLASEAFISSFTANYDLHTWIARFPNVVGERSTHGVIHDFMKKLSNNKNELKVLGNGEQYKPYLYVKDLIEAIAFIIDNSNEQMNIYNIGVDSRTRVKEIVQILLEEMKLSPKINYTGGQRGWKGDVPEFKYDLSKIHKLGWQAKLSSNQAVRKSIQQILKYQEV